MLTTTNYALKKPEGTDVVDIQNFNDNADIIDAKLKEVNTSLSDLVYQTAGGTATAITLTMQTLVTGYAKTFIASANNSGAATTINGKQLYKPGTTTAPTLILGKAYTVWYNSTANCFFIKASAEGDAVAANVLATKTFSNDNDTGLTGTMINNNVPSTTLAINGSYTIPVGYHPGTEVVTQSITTKSAATFNPSTVVQTIAATQYLTGIQTIVATTGTANTAQVLASYTFNSANGIGLTGTIPSKTAATFNPSTTVQTIAAGQYLSGAQTIAATTGTANTADVVAGKTFNSASGIAQTGTATIASLGGKKYATGSVTATKLTSVTVSCGFTPRIMIIREGADAPYLHAPSLSPAPSNQCYQLASNGANMRTILTIVSNGFIVDYTNVAVTDIFTYYAWE